MRACTFALLLTLAAGAAGADVVRLTNGRTLEGEATILPDGRVELQASLGTLVLAAGQVARIEPSTSLEERVAVLRARLDSEDAQGLYLLARWVQKQGAVTLARRLFEEVLALDPEHEEAREALGHRRYQDRWVSEEELHALLGEVRFRGRWVSARERDRVLAWETARHLAEAERRRQATFQVELEARRLEWLATQEPLRQPSPVYLYGGPAGYPWGYAPGLPIYRPTHPRQGAGPGPAAGSQARAPQARAPQARAPHPLAGSRHNQGGRTPASASPPAPRLRSGRPPAP